MSWRGIGPAQGGSALWPERFWTEQYAHLHEIIISPLVLAELVIIAEKQRVTFDLAAGIALLKNTPGYRLVALTAPTALRTQQLTTLPDIHDRLIVATALEYGATLLTADRSIISSGIVPVAWE